MSETVPPPRTTAASRRTPTAPARAAADTAALAHEPAAPARATADAAASQPPPRTSRDPRTVALLILCAGVLMIILDTTIVSVAQPSIQADLGFSPPASPGSSTPT